MANTSELIESNLVKLKIMVSPDTMGWLHELTVKRLEDLKQEIDEIQRERREKREALRQEAIAQVNKLRLSRGDVAAEAYRNTPQIASLFYKQSGRPRERPLVTYDQALSLVVAELIDNHRPQLKRAKKAA